MAQGEFCCSSRLSVQHIPRVCAAPHDASIMLRKEGGVINTHLLPPHCCDEGRNKCGRGKGKIKKNFKLIGKLYFASHKIIRGWGGCERVVKNRVKISKRESHSDILLLMAWRS